MSGKRNPFRIRKGKETRDMRCVIFVGIERTITDLGTERALMVTMLSTHVCVQDGETFDLI